MELFDVELRYFRNLRNAIGPHVLKLAALCPRDESNTIVVCGSPRSGTTWLTWILGTIPGSTIVFEPLHPEKVPEVNRLGIGPNPYRLPHEDWPEGEDFIRRVLTGRVINEWTLSGNSWRFAIATRLIVKFIHANGVLHWMTTRFPIARPVVIVRHPCAAVSSQVRSGWWKAPEHPRHSRFFSIYPEFRHLVDNLQSQLEILAARWCMDSYCLISAARPRPWTLVSYEKLLLDGENELVRIFDTWGMAPSDEAVARLRERSRTTVGQYDPNNAAAQLARWRTHLDRKQISRILDMAHAFGLDCYDEGPEPGFDKLYL
ncbi:sulfotransferase [Thermodesulfobacteriota bacterium]